jgi:preprotein translocase subunit YajC
MYRRVLYFLDKNGGANHLIIRFLIDVTLLFIWILWSGVRVSRITRQLCPVSWQTAYCNSQSMREGMKQVLQFLVLIPFVLFYSLLYFFMRKYSNNPQRKLSRIHTWSIIVLLVHLYMCLLWCVYVRALGAGAFVVLIVLFGFVVDLALIIRYNFLRRAQKREEEESGMYTTNHMNLIND